MIMGDGMSDRSHQDGDGRQPANPPSLPDKCPRCGQPVVDRGGEVGGWAQYECGSEVCTSEPGTYTRECDLGEELNRLRAQPPRDATIAEARNQIERQLADGPDAGRVDLLEKGLGTVTVAVVELVKGAFGRILSEMQTEMARAIANHDISRAETWARAETWQRAMEIVRRAL